MSNDRSPSSAPSSTESNQRDPSRAPGRPSLGRFLWPAIVIAVVVGGLVWWGQSPEEGPFEGNRAPRFELMDRQGQMVHSAEFAGKPLFINFWATWCEPCRYEMPEIQAVYDEWGGAFEVIAVSDEPLPTIERYIDSYGYTFPVYVDADRSMHQDYLIRAMPTSVFVDARGIIRAVHLGQLTREQIEAYLARIVPQAARP